ncbi:MAG: response regulator [bacterium]|nr:response regulator [bacterium]
MTTTVLLVDDEKHVVNVVGTMLEQRDFRVVTANSGEEALAMLEEITPDLALLDIILPGIDGATLAQRLRAHPPTENVPIVFLTGLVEADEIHRGGNQIGGQYFLAKPFDSTELFDVIDRAMSDI